MTLIREVNYLYSNGAITTIALPFYRYCLQWKSDTHMQGVIALPEDGADAANARVGVIGA